MKVEEIKEYSSTVLDILQSLLPQLSKNAALPTEELARRIVESNATRLLVAEEGGIVLGMLTIVIFPIPSGVRASIEDVVVDEAGRGRGVGEALSNHALQLANIRRRILGVIELLVVADCDPYLTVVENQ